MKLSRTLGELSRYKSPSPQNSERVEESQHVFPARILVPWFVPKAQNPQCLLLLMSIENAGWSGHICPKFQLCAKTSEYFKSSNLFSLRSRKKILLERVLAKEGEGRENPNLDPLLVEMQPLRNFWQPLTRTLCKLLPYISAVFGRKTHPCNHFLKLSWFFSNLNYNIVLCRECHCSFGCICVWVLIILYFHWEWKRKTTQGEKIILKYSFL